MPARTRPRVDEGRHWARRTIQGGRSPRRAQRSLQDKRWICPRSVLQPKVTRKPLLVRPPLLVSGAVQANVALLQVSVGLQVVVAPGPRPQWPTPQTLIRATTLQRQQDFFAAGRSRMTAES